MSRAFGIAIAIIATIFPYYVSAQAPSCLSGYSWMFNSLGQSPCTMTVALGGACTGGTFTLDPLQSGFEYVGPTLLNANSCRCSTVYYSLLSACALCQNQTFLDWSQYDGNCSIVYNRVFSDPIPSSTKIPSYAYLDVVTHDAFNATAAEIAATATSSAHKSKSNAGAIAGGVVGGVVFLGIVAGLVAFILRRRRLSGPTGPNASTYSYNSVTSPDSVMGYNDGKFNSTIPGSMGSGRIYDPNDPTTFPTNGPVSYSPYSGPITPTITGNTSAVPVPAPAPRTQYTGAPEL